MKVGKLFYVKHKRFFTKVGGTLRLVGNINAVKGLPYDFLHLVDLDGGLRNFDVYDALTFHKPIQVEMASLSEKVVEKLYSVEARVVFREEQVAPLESLIEEKFSALLFKGDLSKVALFRDIIVEKCPPPFPTEGKRIFCFGRWEKAFALIER